MGRLLSILGPTASGKSAVAMAVARRVGGEIVCCDSMTVYRGLDIGTAKPTREEQAEVPHHLLDLMPIEEPFGAAAFVDRADEVIRDILGRGRQPILCGGTGLYARVLLYGVPLQPGDAAVAGAIREVYARDGIGPLLAELEAADPVSAERTRDNPRRVMRALEIVRLTGEPVGPSEGEPPEYAAPEAILMPSPEASRKAIARRTQALLEAGWVEEVAELVEAGLLESPTASQALGYRDIAAWLAEGSGDREALEETLVRLTSRYAKRQRTWFRHQHPRGVVVPVEAGSSAEELADRVLAEFGKNP